MRNRNRAVLKGISKSKKSLEILGCDRGFLLKYIEDMFYGEMTWDNYGAYWHLDHKKPCSSFDFSIDGEIEKCFHYSNLQPLTAIDNLKKYNKCL